jgi:hypothetical protein
VLNGVLYAHRATQRLQGSTLKAEGSTFYVLNGVLYAHRATQRLQGSTLNVLKQHQHNH